MALSGNPPTKTSGSWTSPFVLLAIFWLGALIALLVMIVLPGLSPSSVSVSVKPGFENRGADTTIHFDTKGTASRIDGVPSGYAAPAAATAPSTTPPADAKGETNGTDKPKPASDAKPTTADDAKPTTADDAKPTTASDAKPTTADDAAPTSPDAQLVATTPGSVSASYAGNEGVIQLAVVLALLVGLGLLVGLIRANGDSAPPDDDPSPDDVVSEAVMHARAGLDAAARAQASAVEHDTVAFEVALVSRSLRAVAAQWSVDSGLAEEAAELLRTARELDRNVASLQRSPTDAEQRAASTAGAEAARTLAKAVAGLPLGDT